VTEVVRGLMWVGLEGPKAPPVCARPDLRASLRASRSFAFAVVDKTAVAT
jgi:hypothetical protein